MHKELKILASLLLSAIIALIIYFNCGLYYQPSLVARGSGLINRDIVEQLAFLKKRMHQGAAADMQQLYPEGYIFMHALYGLAWCEVAEKMVSDSVLYRNALEEIDWSYWSVRSGEAKRNFDESLPLPYGAFYCGWSNYLLGKKLRAAGKNRGHPDVEDFKNNCSRIAEYFRAKGSTPYPESYPGGAWPADGMMCVASLALHDRLFDPVYKDILQRWVADVKLSADVNGLIPHAVDASSGKPLENARGCSQSLMLNFLLEIDSVFAHQQFAIFKKLFLDQRLGLFGVREYSFGDSGDGDVDSGPVIFQIGAAASIVSIRTMNLYKEGEYSTSLRNSVEAFGFPVHQDGMKMYLFGKLPMADVFITWANAAAMLQDEEPVFSEDGRMIFHAYSLIPVILCVSMLVFLWRKGRRRPTPLRVS